MQVKLNCITQPSTTTEDLDSIGVIERYLKPEEYVINAARVSSPENRLDHDTAPKLLKYLIDHHHWSPFEMIGLGFEIQTSRAIAQQMLRHRSFSFQEFSQRYAKVDAMEPIELRYAADTNRQSSSNVVVDGQLIRKAQRAVEHCQQVYEELVDAGVATETARFVLPLTTQTTVIMHGTLRSWIHFLDQRCDEHAQKEIRLIALEIREQLSDICPWTAAALEWNDA